MPRGILNGDLKMFRVSGRCGNDESNRVVLEVRIDGRDCQWRRMRAISNDAV